MAEVAGGPPSMQAMMRRRRRSGFVGRIAEIDSYRSNLRLRPDDEQRRYLFTVYGDAGVGKTSLVSHLHGVATEQGALCAYVDHPALDVVSAMDAIAGQFAQSGSPMSAYAERSATYQRRRRELETDPEAPKGSGRALARLALRVGLRAAGDLPVLGAVADEVDVDTVVDQAERLRAFIGAKFRGHDDMQLLLAPVEVLTAVFVTDLRRLAALRPIALFFDTFERTSPVLDGWLRELLDGHYGELPANLTVMVAGQHSLDPNAWAEYLGEMVQMALNPFSQAEAHELLARRGVTDARVVEVIMALSGGLPLLLAMLADGSPADPAAVGDRSGDAVERFLKWVEDERHRQVALLAALPRQVNEDTLAVLVGSDQAGALFDWLRRQPFLSEAQGTCRYHDVVRWPMLRLQRGQAPQRWMQNHRTIADAYARWREDLGLAIGERWSDARWRAFYMEEIYHRLCAEGLPTLTGALSSVVYALEAEPSIAALWADMIHQAGRDAAVEEVERIGARLLHATVDGELLTVLLEQPGIDTMARVVALGRRALKRANQGRLESAVDDYDRAIALRPDYPITIAWRGGALRLMRRYEDAVADLSRAIELAPEYGDAIALRGETYRQMGRYEEALADLDRAVELHPDDDLAIGSRAETYRQVGRYEEALADFNRAIELNPDYAWALASRGTTYERLGRYEEALADLTSAIDLNPGYSWALANRGQTFQSMDRLEEALDDLSVAIELDPGYQWAIAQRGETYRQAGRYEQALADCNCAIELNPGYGWAITCRGETYLQMGRHEEAMADFDRAVDLDPASDWRRFCRALVHLGLGQDDVARTELQTAITAAQAELQQRPRRFEVLFNAALYRTACGEFEAAYDMYQIGIRQGATAGQARTALCDLELLASVAGHTPGITRVIAFLKSSAAGPEYRPG